MKSRFVILCIGIIIFSCKPDSEVEETQEGISVTTASIPGEELYDLELIFDEDSGFIPMIESSDCEGGNFLAPCIKYSETIKSEVIDKIKNVDESIEVDPNQIRVYFDVAVLLKELTREQKDNIIDNLDVLHAQAKINSFDLFLSKPIMQSEEFIEHGLKPMMQTQYNYDVTNKRSLLIGLIGGGDPIISQIPDRRVWILDAGIDNTHQDLSTSDYTYSVDFTIPSTSPNNNPFQDDIGHGTFIAGIVGGKASDDIIYRDGYGINGVMPGIAMASIKIFKTNNPDKPKAKSDDMVTALSYVAAHAKAGDVVNISWGIQLEEGESCGSDRLADLRTAFMTLANDGVIIVVSAGNYNGKSMETFPSCLNHGNIFTIGSVGVNSPGSYSYSWFSNYGIPSVDYLTPGEEIFTTAPEGRYAMVSGTSFSAAIFSGIVYNGTLSVGVLGSVRRGDDGSGIDPPYNIAKLE